MVYFSSFFHTTTLICLGVCRLKTDQKKICSCIFFPVALRPNVDLGLLILEVSRSHTTTHHSRYDSSGRVISSSQRPVPDKAQHLQQTNIHAPGGIRTHNLSRRDVADLRLRPRGYWDRLHLYYFNIYIYIYMYVKWCRYRPGVAQRVCRGIALFFHDRSTRRGWVVSSTPRPHFTSGKDPVPILQEAGWAPRPVWTGGKSHSLRDSIPDRPALVSRYTDWATGPTV